jgi:hypothetical protein
MLAVVKVLVVEPIGIRVWVTSRPRSTSRSPYPFERTISLPLTIATATPLTFHCRISFKTKSSNPVNSGISCAVPDVSAGRVAVVTITRSF